MDLKITNLLNETINDLVKVMIIKDKSSITKEDVILQEVFENIQSTNFQFEEHLPV
jgi:hypothetical protein